MIGDGENEGRLEIFYRGEWGTICDDGWGISDTQVACRNLGFTTGSMSCCGGLGQGTGSIWLDDVQCTGSESSLADCASRGIGIHNCRHGEDVGVRCWNTGKNNHSMSEILSYGIFGWAINDHCLLCHYNKIESTFV